MAYHDQAPPITLDRARSIARMFGEDPDEMEPDFGFVLAHIHHALPAPPVAAASRLSALPGPGDGIDRVSGLSDATSSRASPPRTPRSPAAAARSGAPPRSSSWTTTCSRTRTAPRATGSPTSTSTTPTPAPSLPPSPASSPRTRVARWLQHLTVKGVQELFLINRPWPLEVDLPVPSAFFSMTSLTRLYLGFWKFPDTTSLPRGAAFPRLRELGLCNVVIDNQDMDFVLARSPVLEILCFQGHMLPPLRLRLVSRSLRCVQMHGSNVESIDVVDAPRLERLFLRIVPTEAPCCRIKIGHAPALSLLGRLNPASHELQVGDTIIKAGTVVNQRTMVVPTVKILVVNVRFEFRNDAKMLPIFLKCFPHIETLHIHSQKTVESTGRLNVKFWQESGPIECIQSHINVMVFHDFRGERSELAFLKFFIESAHMLKS